MNVTEKNYSIKQHHSIPLEKAQALFALRNGVCINFYDSEEAKNFDFDEAELSVRGNREFIHIEFLCPGCQKYYTVTETTENVFLIERWK